MPAIKDFPIQVGDKTYLFRYNFAALALIEDLSKKMTGNLRSLQVLVYAGLRQNHPNVTLEDIPNILDSCDDLADVSTLVTQAVDAFAAKKKPTANPPTSEAISTKTADLTMES